VTVEGANAFLRERYIAGFNQKFTVTAAEKGTAFRRTTRSDLDWIFTVQSERVVGKDNTVAMADRGWQLDKSRFRSSLARCTVTIHEHLDEALSIRYGPHVVGRYMATGQVRRPAKATIRRDVEKTGPWKPWTTTNRFPTVPTVPWKTRQTREFPTFPRPLPLGLPPCKPKTATPLRQDEGVRRTEQPKTDRSDVNKSGQID
jgi:hypothetical protein